MSRRPAAALGDVVVAERVVEEGLEPGRARRVILLLAGSVALMMTGYGIIMPVFARRLDELGGGVGELGMMTVAFALAQLVAAPFMGALADRRGRRPVILMALAAFATTNVAFLFAPSTEAFIVIRAAEGALTAGLFPAAMGVVADVVPENQRGRWVGVVMGSYAAGFVLGPVIGGVLYDGWGYAAPFAASAAMGALALVAAIVVVPETRTEVDRQREALEQQRELSKAPGGPPSVWASLPRPHHVFAALLVIDFIIIFAFAFTEPQMVFYVYDELGFTTVQFGVVLASYGVVTVLGQAGLGRLSDRRERRPIIVTGLALSALFYLGLTSLTSFPVLVLVAAVAGVGEALVMPALNAFLIDISAAAHRARVMGIKESVAALGGVLGPLAVIVASRHLTATEVFFVSFVLVMAAAAVALVALQRPEDVPDADDAVAREYARQRTLAAQATFHGIVTSASAARESATL